MHTGDVQQSDVAVHTRLGIDVSAFTNFLAAIDGLTILELVAREDGTALLVESRELIELFRSHLEREIPVGVVDLVRVTHVAVVELILGFLVPAKYNFGGQSIGGVVDRHAGHISQDLTSHKVSLASIKHRLSCDDIIVAILCDLLPQMLRNRLIPRKTQLLMVNAEFDLPFLQALFLGAEVINVRIRDIIGLTEEAVVALGFLLAANDLLGEVVELLLRIAHQTSIENMVVVPAAVEPDETELHQLLDFLGLRVNHPYNGLVGSFNFPVHQEQVREHLHVVKDELSLVVFDSRAIFGGFERHLVHKLDAVFRLVAAISCKGQDGVAHIGDIIGHAAFIRIRQDFVDKVDAGLSSRMDLFVEITFNLESKPFLALNHFGVYHVVFSFQR